MCEESDNSKATFGQRYLNDETSVFNNNAWDNVDWPEEKEAEALETIERQKLTPVSSENIDKLRTAAGKYWEAFYNNHNNKFFMDRKWVAREFPEIFQKISENKKLLLKLSCETAKHREYLEKLLETESGRKLLKSEEIKRNYHVAMVVLYEMVIGQGSRNCKGPLAEAFKRFKSAMKIEADKMKESGLTAVVSDDSTLTIPRYARINTLKVSADEVLEKLKTEGFIIKALESGLSRKKFRRAIKNMSKNDVYVDTHVANLLIFRPGIDLHAFPMVVESELILQDKASCFPVTVLDLPTTGNIEVIDACASPGMKTSHLAAVMRNKGKIYAFDRDADRAMLLKDRLKKLGVKNAFASLADFLKINVMKNCYRKVKYAVVDPPCSGSGMVKRNYAERSDDVPDEQRIRTLANLQAMILKHALKLPQLKRCVYSTCSIYEAENEGVVLEAISDQWIAERFKLVDALPAWPHRGQSNGEYEGIGEKCLRAGPQEDLTNGFFVALFQRKEPSEEEKKAEKF